MSKALKTLAILAMLALLSACATGPTYADVAPTLSPPPEDSARVFIYRTALLGAAVQPDVKLNGDVVGRAVPGGFFYVDRPPGNYEMVTSTEVDRKLSFTLDKGQTRYVRLEISLGFFVGHVYPELVEASVGAKEIQKTSYTGGTQ